MSSGSVVYALVILSQICPNLNSLVVGTASQAGCNVWETVNLNDYEKKMQIWRNCTKL